MTTIHVDKYSSKRINATIKKDGVAMSLTWMTVNIQINEKYNDDTVIVNAEMTVSDSANWVVYYDLANTVTDIAPWNYVYHIWVVDWASKPHSVDKWVIVIWSSIEEPWA